MSLFYNIIINIIHTNYIEEGEIMHIETPLYVAYITTTITGIMLDKLLGFKKDFDDSYHCTVLFSEKEVSVEDILLDTKDTLVPMFTGTIIDYTIFESEIYGKSFVLKIDCQECVDTHNRLMKKYDASFDYPEYISHVTLMYDLPDNIDPDELFKKFAGREIVFDTIRYEKFNNEKYKEDE